MEKRIIRSTSRHSSRVRDPNNSTMAPRTSPFALQIQPGTRPWCSLGNMREQPRCHRFLAFKRSRGRDGVSSHRGIRAQLRGGKEKGKWKQTRHCWRWKDEIIQGCEFLRIDSMPLFIDPVTESELRVFLETRVTQENRSITRSRWFPLRKDNRRSMIADPSVSKMENVGGGRAIFSVTREI